MSKENKFTKSSKMVIAGALGVGVLLSTPSLLSAETRNQNEVEVQANAGVNPPETDMQKPEGQKESKTETGNVKVAEEENAKQDGTKEKTISSQKPEGQKESKTETGNVKVAEEENAKQDGTKEKTISSQKTEATSIDRDNILIKTDGENGVWTKPKGVEGSRYISPANTYAGKVVHLSQKMVVGNITWYQFSVDGKEVGWVESKVFENGLTDIYSYRNPYDEIVSKDTNDGIWSLPSGVSGARYIASSNVYSFDTIKITAEAKMNGQKWYAFSVDEKHVGWIPSKALDFGRTVKTDGLTSTLGWVVIANSSHHGIWTKPYGLAYSKYVAPTRQYAYENVRIIKKVTLQGTEWGQVKNEKGIIGWIDLGKATAKGTYPKPIGSGVGSVKGNLKSSHGIWTQPYGEEDAKWVGPVSDYSLKPVKILQKVEIFPKVGLSTTWCKIQIGNRVLGWVDADTLLDRSVYEQNKTVMVGDVNGHGIWTQPYGLEGAKYVGNVSDYANSIMQVDKSMKVNLTVWYHVKVGGRDIGWLDSKTISSASDVRQRSGVYHVTTNETRHGVWSRPYGLQNASWIGSAVDNKNKNLELKMSIKLNGTTWFAFDNGRGGVFWMDSQAVTEGKIK